MKALDQSLVNEIFDRMFEKRLNHGCFSRFQGISLNLKEDLCRRIRAFIEKPKVEKLDSWKDSVLSRYFDDTRKGERYLKDPKGYARAVEALIRLLKTVEKTPELCVVLAELLIQRAKLLNPKGFGANPKKAKMLREAVALLDEAIKNKEKLSYAYRLKVSAYYELKREPSDAGVPDNYYEVLEEALRRNKERINEPEFELAAIELAESERTDVQELLVKIGSNSKDNTHRSMAFSLLNQREKAKEHFDKALNETAELARKGILSFTHPVWEKLHHAAELLDGDRDAAVSLWKTLKGFENTRRYHGLHLLWYWSRLTDIYSLAFRRAYDDGDYLTAFWVADGLKARPLIQWQVLEHVFRKEGFEDYVEAEVYGRLGYYVRKSGGLKRRGTDSEFAPFEPPPFKLKDGIAVVSLYLSEKEGYGLVLEGSGVKSTFRFDANPLWKIYLSYSEALSRGADVLKHNIGTVCLEMGKAFGELFELDSDKIKRLVIIPHGFLHLFPFHGAYSEEKGMYLLEKFDVSYLPSFELALKCFSDDTTFSDEKVALIDEESRDFSDFVPELEEKGFHRSDVRIFEKPEKLHTLAIVCHGKANPANPFESVLKVGEGITVKDVLSAGLKAKEVYLVACESDLAFPTAEQVDEHLSLGTVFLSKKSRFVFSNLWEAKIEKLKNIVPELVDADDKVSVLMEEMKSKIPEGLPSEKGVGYRLADALPFRIYDVNIFAGG
ncbi:MAG: CHAT domain-containing protein [Deferribacteres bacterium]|nr:CHAT domain-containing protein [Deferribacteres bacterium]